jgi:hypothetical protein
MGLFSEQVLESEASQIRQRIMASNVVFVLHVRDLEHSGESGVEITIEIRHNVLAVWSNISYLSSVQ